MSSSNDSPSGTDALADRIKAKLAELEDEFRLPEVRKQIHRLAELNVRSTGPIDRRPNPLEDVEREFLTMSLPHMTRMFEYRELLTKLGVEYTSSFQ